MITRRKLLQGSAAVAAGTLLPRPNCAAGFKSANDRPMMAAIGTGSRWYQKATGLNGTYGSAPQSSHEFQPAARARDDARS